MVLFSPEDGIRLVKRVVSLPGDTIEMRNTVLIVNGRLLDYQLFPNEVDLGLAGDVKNRSVAATEDLLGKKHAVMTIPSIPELRTFAPVTMPDGSYFVMGDNRDNSKDSRYFGCVERKAIIGEVKGVVLSINKLEKYQPRWNRFVSGIDLL